MAALASSAWAMAAGDPPSAAAKDFATASPVVFSAAIRGLEMYRDTRPYKSEWKVASDPSSGIIETNWYPEHKGEVRLKIQISVWGESFRVDAWQKLGITSSVTKTEWSRRTERSVQNSVEAQLQREKSGK
jgi:hypothetical protein